MFTVWRYKWAVVMVTGTLLLGGCSQEQKPSAHAETKQADDVFGRWIKTQNVFKDRSPEMMKDHINDTYVATLKSKYQDQAELLAPLNEFIESVFAAEIKNGQLNATLNDSLKKNLTFIYGLLENDLTGFVDFLRHHGLESHDVNQKDKEIDFHDVIKKYYGFMQLLFAHNDYFPETEYLFSVANRFFEFFFRPETWPQGKKMLLDPAMYPIARIFYSTIWYYLSGHGWKHWNEGCLDALKKEYDQGKTIVYIASGNDLWQLFRKGIYNVEVIDPLLPSQPKFYAEGWSWIIREDGIGDKIEMKIEDKEFELRRVEFRTYGTFRAKLHTGLEEDVPKTMTRWAVYDKKTNKQLGNWVINRRFSTQDDFKMDPKKVLLLSFNELYFVTTISPAKSWGIDPNQFQDDFKVYVKQLRAPVTKQMAQNMQAADASEFSFIALGSQIN